MNKIVYSETVENWRKCQNLVLETIKSEKKSFDDELWLAFQNFMLEWYMEHDNVQRFLQDWGQKLESIENYEAAIGSTIQLPGLLGNLFALYPLRSSNLLTPLLETVVLFSMFSPNQKHEEFNELHTEMFQQGSMWAQKTLEGMLTFDTNTTIDSAERMLSQMNCTMTAKEFHLKIQQEAKNNLIVALQSLELKHSLETTKVIQTITSLLVVLGDQHPLGTPLLSEILQCVERQQFQEQNTMISVPYLYSNEQSVGFMGPTCQSVIPQCVSSIKQQPIHESWKSLQILLYSKFPDLWEKKILSLITACQTRPFLSTKTQFSILFPWVFHKDRQLYTKEAQLYLEFSYLDAFVDHLLADWIFQGTDGILAVQACNTFTLVLKQHHQMCLSFKEDVQKSSYLSLLMRDPLMKLLYTEPQVILLSSLMKELQNEPLQSKKWKHLAANSQWIDLALSVILTQEEVVVTEVTAEKAAAAAAAEKNVVDSIQLLLWFYGKGDHQNASFLNNTNNKKWMMMMMMMRMRRNMTTFLNDENQTLEWLKDNRLFLVQEMSFVAKFITCYLLLRKPSFSFIQSCFSFYNELIKDAIQWNPKFTTESFIITLLLSSFQSIENLLLASRVELENRSLECIIQWIQENTNLLSMECRQDAELYLTELKRTYSYGGEKKIMVYSTR